LLDFPLNLEARLTLGAQITRVDQDVWRLEIPSGPPGTYRLAQLDDHGALSRSDFRWKSHSRLQIRARASAPTLPCTWGMGLWNDPFSMGLLSGSHRLRLLALPNTVWFFFASPPNYLSFRDDLPAQGGLAATFRSPRLPAVLLAPALLGLPFLAIPPIARLLRRWVQRIISQDAVALNLEPTVWHNYAFEWTEERVDFSVDCNFVLRSPISPLPPLGLVIWVDNQYLAFPPDGRLRYGTLPNLEPAWIEIGLKVGPNFA
jgi:hypothetical protein